LLGYDNYFTTTLLEVHALIEKHESGVPFCKSKIWSAFVTEDSTGKRLLNFPYADEREFIELVTESSKQTISVISIMPMGTTLSATYKLHNILLDYKRKHYTKNSSDDGNIRSFDFALNYCIILCKPDNDDDDIVRKYWEKDKTGSDCKKVILASLNYSQKYSEKPAIVEYFLAASAKWIDPYKDSKEVWHKSEGKDSRPMIQVDKTSTVPDAIFPLIGSKRECFDELNPKKDEAFKNNNEKMQPLRGLITYSHIATEESHHLFHIDFPAYFGRKRSDIENWLDEVGKAALNIIISPGVHAGS